MTRLLSFLRTLFTFHSSFLRINNFLPSFRKFPSQPFSSFWLCLSHEKPSNLFHCVGITGWSCVRVYLPYRMYIYPYVCDIIKNDVKEIFILLITLMTHELRKIYCEILSVILFLLASPLHNVQHKNIVYIKK